MILGLPNQAAPKVFHAWVHVSIKTRNDSREPPPPDKLLADSAPP